MNIKNELYCCDNGKDYLMSLREGSRIISLSDLQNGRISEFRFHDHSQAVAQLKEWRRNSLARLPRSFGMETSSLKVSLDNLRETLAKLDLTLPTSMALKNWIVFHGHESMVLDGPWDEKSQLLPVVDIRFLKKVLDGKSTKTRRPQKITGGIFSSV